MDGIFKSRYVLGSATGAITPEVIRKFLQQNRTEQDTEGTMPRIKFSESDLSRGRIVEPAWYVMTINSVAEGTPSKDGGSTNYNTEGTIIRNADTGDETYKGVTLIWNFNSKALGFAQGFLASFGVDVKLDTTYELKSAEGKQLEVFVENGEWQGRIKNQINHKYRPLRDKSDDIPF